MIGKNNLPDLENKMGMLQKGSWVFSPKNEQGM